MFNNKFGKGILKHPGYNDGGFGEAALMGALMGGGSSLITGKNPLTGALLGGLTGGVTGGIGNLAGGENFFSSPGMSDMFGGALKEGTSDGLPALIQSGAPGADELGSFAKSPYGVDLAQGAAGVGQSQTTNALGSGLQTTASPLNYNPNAESMFQNIGQPGGYTPDPSYVGNTMAPDVSNAASQGITTPPIDPNAPATGAANAAAAATKKPGMLGGMWDSYKELPKWQQAAIGVGGMYGIQQLMKPPKMIDPNIGKNNYSGPPLHSLSPNFKPLTVIQPVPYYTAQYAGGGITGLDNQSPMALGMGGNSGYPQGRQDNTQYATPTQQPMSTPVIDSGYEQKTNPFTGEPQGYADGGDITSASPAVENGAAQVINSGIMGFNGEKGSVVKFEDWAKKKVNNTEDAAKAIYERLKSSFTPEPLPYPTEGQDQAQDTSKTPNMGPDSSWWGSQHFAQGGISGLGGYAAGGNPRLLSGPGDGMSDNIPAVIGQKQPARLADGEFVVPADVVSHLGNGSTDAGAKHLYAMMDKVRQARTGNKKQGKQINPNKYLSA